MGCLVGCLAGCLAGCKKKKIEVSDPGEGSTDYGRAKLMAEVGAMGKNADSPEAFRKFHVAIEEARPTFNESVANLAERYTVFLALGPMEAYAAEDPLVQMEKLGLTVWPTALRVEPKKDETPLQYFERICKDELASECKHVVPEAWPARLSVLAWRRFQSRARDAYVRCRGCKDDESYIHALERYNENTTRANAVMAAVRKRSKPSGWARAGDSVAEYSGAPVLSIASDGDALFLGEEVGDGQWREAIRIQRGDNQVLGVHLRPTASVHTLRGILRDAAKAGYSEIALIVRKPTYPYRLGEYRIATRRRGASNVDARDEDTIQVLVRALDATTKRLASEDKAASAPLRL